MFKLNQPKAKKAGAPEVTSAASADEQEQEPEQEPDFRSDRHNKIELPKELWMYIRNGTYIICTKADGKQIFGYLTSYAPDNGLIKLRTGYRKTPNSFVTATINEVVTIQAEADAVTMFLISKINAIVKVLGTISEQ